MALRIKVFNGDDFRSSCTGYRTRSLGLFGNGCILELVRTLHLALRIQIAQCR